MHEDIEKAIAIIDQRIEALRNIRDQLAQEFGATSKQAVRVSVGGGEAADSSGAKHIPLRRNPPHSASNRNGRSTRKDQIADWLRMNGPATRAEIISGTNFPIGTIAFCLNDKEKF